MYGASEGLRTALLEREAIGGQARTSSLIRNYLGFPRGVSGAELAWRAYEQAWMFGTQFVHGNPAASLATGGDLRMVGLADGSAVTGRAVVIATGVSYRRLDVAELESLAGAGVFYGAAATEARALGGRRAFVVGGGNSAGQAAVHLSKYAQQVSILVRADSLAASMSEYLNREIDTAANIDVRYRTEAAGGGGDGRLEQLRLRRRDTGDTQTEPADGLFILIGAQPFTQWLPEAVARDQRGFILTGPDLAERWTLPREPYLLETSTPGVFAAGDVRHGAVERVASAVGEGVGRHPPGSRLPCVASSPSARQPGPRGDAPNPASMTGARVDRNGRRQEAASTAIRHQQASASPADAQNRPSEQHLQIRGSKSNPPRTARRPLRADTIRDRLSVGAAAGWIFTAADRKSPNRLPSIALLCIESAS